MKLRIWIKTRYWPVLPFHSRLKTSEYVVKDCLYITIASDFLLIFDSC